MKSTFLEKRISRREMFGHSTIFLAGSALLTQISSASLLDAVVAASPQQTSSAAELLAAKRAQFNAAPLETQRLGGGITMLSGPGGTVVVLNGPDGKFIVDTFIAPAWPRLKKTLDGLGNEPVRCVVNTHWHIDHTDNNAPLHAAGATILAHENTKKRMSVPHNMPFVYRAPNGALFSLHIDPKPVNALPQQTFASGYKLEVNGETLTLQHVEAAHTDTDIYVHFEKANVIQVGDLLFNSMYPYIDSSTGGKISGMIAAADNILSLADSNTKIVAGHGPIGARRGPLANKADFAKFRDMLVTSRDRVERLKSEGKSAQEAVAEKPFTDLDSIWGKGIVNADQWVHIVYLTL
jgi:cyclase